MNAINFIKHYGLNTAIRIIEDSQNDDFWDTGTGFYTDKNSESCVCLSDLKRLVESVDLIKFYNGIEKANFLLEMSNRPSLRPPHPSEVKLKQAIADYDSIYGGEHV